MATAQDINDQLDELALFEPCNLPVISLYLNTQPDQHGRANFESFVRKEFAARANSFPKRSEERESFERDAERIQEWLRTELRPSANGVAIFACSAKDGFFEAVQLDAPIDEHQLYVYHQPHLYTLARLYDQFPRYIVVVADTNAARIFLFGLRGEEGQGEIKNQKTRGTQAGGWSQARYQRHLQNYHQQHVKELVDALDRLVRSEKIDKILFAGDDVVLPLIEQELTQTLRERVVDRLKLDITAPEHEILRASLEAVRATDSETDQEKVDRALNQWRSRGLGAAGLEEVMKALANGQVDELLISAKFEQLNPEPAEVSAALTPHLEALDGQVAPEVKRPVLLADELVTMARQSSSGVTFIEDHTLLEAVGGIAASLRYRI
ncbi:MAG: host attachment protein [Bryobacteraceae bacterium]|nr:host attachment protein [Bryobacteraceae bacterium]